MDVSSLIQLMQNKESMLSNAVGQAFASGDLERMNAIEKDLLETQNTLSQLRLLAQINHAAAASNITPAEVVASGVDSVLNVVQGPSAGAIVNGYDISAYATDPLHEQKIQNIISAMPPFNSLGDIDAYIQYTSPGSPISAQMVQNAASLYAVDLLLMLAIMQNDSNFGTLGVGARTNNPGNVGNTGTEERFYGSWEEGVAAVAEWLSRHRYVAPQSVVVPESVSVPITEEVEKPKKKKKEPKEPEPELEPEVIPDVPVEIPIESATSTLPVIEPSATSTPSGASEQATSTATTTEPLP